MDRHRLFTLETTLSLMGLEVDDWIVVLGGWTLALQLAGFMLPPRPRLLIATLVAGIGFLVYRRLKDRVPQKFFRHLLTYLTEADTYRAFPDVHNLCPVISMPGRISRGLRTYAADS